MDDNAQKKLSPLPPIRFSFAPNLLH